MTEYQFVGNLIKTLLILFLALVVFISTTAVGNEMINSSDTTIVLLGFGLYPFTGILEILIGYALYRTWK